MHALSDLCTGTTHHGISESLERSHLPRQNTAVLHQTPDCAGAPGTSPGRDLATRVDGSGDATSQETGAKPKGTKENSATASFLGRETLEPDRETIETPAQDCAGPVITQFPQQVLAVTAKYRTAANLQFLQQIETSDPEGFYYSLTANNKYSLFHIQQVSVTTGVPPQVWGDSFFVAICKH